MKHTLQITLIALATVAALAAGGYALYTTGMQQGMTMAESPTSATTTLATLEPVPQSIAQGEDATRRHMAAGITGRRHGPAAPVKR